MITQVVTLIYLQTNDIFKQAKRIGSFRIVKGWKKIEYNWDFSLFLRKAWVIEQRQFRWQIYTEKGG